MKIERDECDLDTDCIRFILDNKLAPDLIRNRKLHYPVLHRLALSDSRCGYNEDFPLDCRPFRAMKMLFECDGIDLGVRDVGDHSLLAALVVGNKPEQLKYVMEKLDWDWGDLSKDVNYRNENLLYLACKNACSDILKYLLTFDTLRKEVNKIGGRDGDTLLNVCAKTVKGYDPSWLNRCSNFKCFETLLQLEDIDPYIKNKKGWDAFDMCRRSGKREYLDMLEKFLKQSKSKK